MRIAMSSGHSTQCQGADDILNEVEEATSVVDRTAEMLRERGVECVTFHDLVSDDQSENLNRITNWHNDQNRDWDVSIHFNAFEHTSKAMGTECLYVSDTGEKMATTIAAELASVGFVPRGAKFRSDLHFLNQTDAPAVLVEVCFVDSSADATLYQDKFEETCAALAGALAGQTQPIPMPPEVSTDDEAIMDIALTSAIAQYQWRDRGKAPAGYIQGFGLAWAQVVRAWQAGDVATIAMAKANSRDADVDALAVYADEYAALGMDISKDGIDTLRGLYALLLGQGMRESSGQHCCGRDQSASNTDPNTCETGLYQTSYNSHDCCPEFDMLTEEYEGGGEREGYLSAFAEGVTCSAADWECYGSPSDAGFQFQQRCKHEPAYAVETTALVLRHRCMHYGPIKRKETELRADADVMLRDIQDYVMGEEVAPPSPDWRWLEHDRQLADHERRISALEAQRNTPSANPAVSTATGPKRKK